MIPRMSRRRFEVTAVVGFIGAVSFGLFRAVRKVRNAAAHASDL